MKYYIEKTTNYSFDEAVEKVTEELKKENFIILSEVNIHEKFKEKLDVDFRKYRILGVCNLRKVYKALQYENKIGTLLPCNVIVQELADEEVEVAAVDPEASMMSVEGHDLTLVAKAKEKLQRVIHSL